MFIYWLLQISLKKNYCRRCKTVFVVKLIMINININKRFQSVTDSASLLRCSGGIETVFCNFGKYPLDLSISYCCRLISASGKLWSIHTNIHNFYSAKSLHLPSLTLEAHWEWILDEQEKLLQWTKLQQA